MHYSDRPRAFNFLTGFLLGAAVGTALTVVLARDGARDTRRRLIEAAADARRSAGSTWTEAAQGLRRTIRPIRLVVRP